MLSIRDYGCNPSQLIVKKDPTIWNLGCTIDSIAGKYYSKNFSKAFNNHLEALLKILANKFKITRSYNLIVLNDTYIITYSPLNPHVFYVNKHQFDIYSDTLMFDIHRALWG